MPVFSVCVKRLMWGSQPGTSRRTSETAWTHWNERDTFASVTAAHILARHIDGKLGLLSVLASRSLIHLEVDRCESHGRCIGRCWRRLVIGNMKQSIASVYSLHYNRPAQRISVISGIPIMGALLSIPLLSGGVGAIASSIFSGCMIFMGEWIGWPPQVLMLTLRRHSCIGVLQIMQLQLVHRYEGWFRRTSISHG